MAKVTVPEDILDRKEERKQLFKARKAEAMKAPKSKKKGSKNA